MQNISPSVKVFVNTAQYVKHIDNVKVKLPRIATSSKVTKAAARKHILWDEWLCHGRLAWGRTLAQQQSIIIFIQFCLIQVNAEESKHLA